MHKVLPGAFFDAFRWIIEMTAGSVADGRHEMEEGMFAIVQSYETNDPAGMRLENHRKYIDIQYMMQGWEVIAWCKPDGHAVCAETYSNEKDIEFFFTTGIVPSSLVLHQGMVSIFWPSDWHAPCLSPPSTTGVPEPIKVRKIVVKVPVTAIDA